MEPARGPPALFLSEQVLEGSAGHCAVGLSVQLLWNLVKAVDPQNSAPAVISPAVSDASQAPPGQGDHLCLGSW